jgi:hypothetical protein
MKPLRVVWTFVAVGSSFPILGLTLGLAAWNGVNWAVCLYLIASAGGFIGLLAGFRSAFSARKILRWITCVSALAIISVSVIYASGFIFGRAAGVPLGYTMYSGGSQARLQAPVLAVYAVAILCCLIEALLYIPCDRKLKTT